MSKAEEEAQRPSNPPSGSPAPVSRSKSSHQLIPPSADPAALSRASFSPQLQHRGSSTQLLPPPQQQHHHQQQQQQPAYSQQQQPAYTQQQQPSYAQPQPQQVVVVQQPQQGRPSLSPLGNQWNSPQSDMMQQPGASLLARVAPPLPPADYSNPMRHPSMVPGPIPGQIQSQMYVPPPNPYDPQMFQAVDSPCMIALCCCVMMTVCLINLASDTGRYASLLSVSSSFTEICLQ